MPEIETVSFTCECGKKLMARREQAGRMYACPGCGMPVMVPAIGATPTANTNATAPNPAPAGARGRRPGSISELALWLFIAWSALAFAALIISFFGSLLALIALGLAGVVTLLALHQGWTLLAARHRVLSEKDVPILYGLCRLIAWDPTEGILLLRDKKVDFVDDDLHDGEGGVRLIYPSMGEEVALRVPLEVQTLNFTDTNVLTREYLNLSIRASMKWRIEKIEQFYLLVSRELRSSSDKVGEMEELTQTARRHAKVSAQRMTVQLMNAAVEWLRGLAQEQTRIVVSRVRSGLLIADRLMADVPEVRGVDALSASSDLGNASDGLASAIHQTLSERLKEFGIAVVDVTLQEIRLPEEIVSQCVAAAKTAYVPLMSKRNATQRHAELKAEADVLGKEAVAAREVIASAPAYALRDFLSEFITKTAKPAADAIKPTIDLSKLQAIEDTGAKQNEIGSEEEPKAIANQ